MQTANSYDVVVIGGGPAGSTAGALLAQYGHRTLIVERTPFPRFHIGESLMPETYWTFQRIGMLEKLRRSTFVPKYSVQFANSVGRESAPFYFDERNPHECSQTWQVLRSEFDQLMLDNAREHGSEVWMPATVDEVIFEPAGAVRLPRATGVIVSRAGQPPQRIAARVVVDATGTSGLISRKLGIRRAHPELRKAAVFAHYRGGLRDAGRRDEGATLVLSLKDEAGWFWYIPLPGDLVSVGVVADVDYLIKGRAAPEQILAEEIERCPALMPRIASATRVSPVHVLSDFSYAARVCAGDGWVLTGDALTFLDPIYSSGVFLALRSGELAADAIHEALLADDPSAERLGRWGDAFYVGVQSICKLVYAFYTRGFSFGQFVRAHPEFRDNITRLLIGDVFEPRVNEVFGPMSQWCRLPEPMRLESPASGRVSSPT